MKLLLIIIFGAAVYGIGARNDGKIAASTISRQKEVAPALDADMPLFKNVLDVKM